MAGTSSGGISFQGLGSGTDFTATIDALKKFELIPTNRMTVWKSEWNVRIEAFNDIIKTMEEARSALREFSNLDGMMLRDVSSSNDKVATAKANSKIEEGVYSIDVKQLAKAAIFSSKKVYSAKNEKVNDTGAVQTFTYTYKGTTSKLEIANGTTLEQFADKINKDPKNPGVKAALVKSGAGYVLQIQGKETGAASSLSIESSMPDFDSSPHFSGRDYVVNPDADKNFTFTYKGKDFSVNVKQGMTAGELTDEINKLSSSSGLTVNLNQKGSDYTLQWKDSTTRQVINVPTRSDIPALGAQGFKSDGTKFAGTDSINSTGEVQTYRYSYRGTEYTLNVAAGTTMDGLVSQINSSASKAAGLTAKFNASTGKIDFDSTQNFLNSSDSQPMTFSFNRPGFTGPATLGLATGSSLDDFVNQFNKSEAAKPYEDTNGTGVGNFDGMTAYLENGPNPGEKILKFKNTKTNTELTSAELTALGITSNVPGLGDGTAVAQSTKTNVGISVNTPLAGMGGMAVFSGKNISVNDSGTSQTYSYTSNGVTRTFGVPADTTMEQFTKLFNDDIAAYNANASTPADKKLDLKAAVSATGSGYEIKMTNLAGDKTAKPDTVTTSMPRLRGAQDNWYSSQAQDAIFTLNGWGQELTSNSNTLTEVVDGLTITMKGQGETSLTVTNDSKALKENIHKAVDAINTMRAKIRELSKVDTKKTVKAPETDDSSGLLKLQSQFTWQMGSAATGNYGVQMLSSRINNLTANTALGFVARKDVNDSFNDLFTSFSQLGISTITDESDTLFGQLSIDDTKLDAAIAEDFRGVAALFSADKQASTDSADFSIASTGTKAKAGVYDVTYDVDPGTKQAINVKINGVTASSDSAFPGRWTVGDTSNAAAGLAIQFSGAELTPRAPGNPYANSVRIKDGKVNEMIDLLDAELQPVIKDSEEKAGALPLLVSNYQGIVKNIDKKIERETTRVALWEQRQKAKFSRLDTLLTQYNQKMQSAQAALAQISSSN